MTRTASRSTSPSSSRSATGYRNLCRLVTEAHTRTRRASGASRPLPRPRLDQLEERHGGPRLPLGLRARRPLAGRMGSAATRSGQRRSGGWLAAVFGPERFRVELQRPFWRHDRARNRWLEGLAERLGVACVATGNVHMHDRSRAPLQDALVAVRLHGTLEATEPGRRGNSSSALTGPAEMAERFRDHPRALAESARLAERLRFDLTRDLGYRYPGSEDPSADRALAEICRARLEHRYAGMPELSGRGRAAPGGGAGGDPQARALRLLPPPLRHPRAGPRGRGRGARARLGADAAAARAGRARASARSSAT